MKKIKYIISFILLFLVFLLTGELYQVHLSEFPITDLVVVQLVSDNSFNEFKNHIKDNAKENNVSVCIADIATDYSFMNTEVNIFYFDENIKNQLNNIYEIFSGTFPSIILSETNVIIQSIDNFTPKSKEIILNLSGKIQNKYSFIEDIENKYSTTFQHINKNNESILNTKSFIVLILIWFLVIIINLAFCFYETEFNKQQNAARFLMGESLKSIYIKNIIKDSCFFIFTVILQFVFLSSFTSVQFLLKTNLVMFVLFLLSNALACVGILKTDIKKAFSKLENSKKLVTLSYTVKLICGLLTVIVASGCFTAITESINVKKQEIFFYKYKDYNYVEVSLEDMSSFDAETRTLALFRSNELIYKLFNYSDTVVLQAVLSDFNTNQSVGKKIIAYNKYAKNILLESIDELRKYEFENDTMYLIIPKYHGYENDIELLKELIAADPTGTRGFFFCHEYEKSEIEIITYTSSADVFALDSKSSGAGIICTNPIIVFSTFDDKEISLTDFTPKINKETNYSFSIIGGLASLLQDFIMFKTDDTEFKKFLSDNNLDQSNSTILKTNVYEKYEDTKIKTSKIAMISFLIFVLMTLLEFFLINNIVKMEYTINLYEISIKKMLGYTFIKRNKTLIIYTYCTLLFGYVASLCFNLFFDLYSPSVLIAGNLLLTLIESSILIYNMLKADKEKTIKALKGGAL